MEPEEEGTKRLACRRCGHIGLDESDGFYYCQECGAQADDIILTGVADEDFVDKDGQGALYSALHTRRSQPTRINLADTSSQAWFRFTQEEDNNDINGNNGIKREQEYYMDELGPTEPEDFGSGTVRKLSYEDYYNEVRIRYVMGMQWMIQLQSEALVEKFNVSPLICGVAGTVWLRFMAQTRVFKDGWADDVLLESEIQASDEPEDYRPPAKYANEPHNVHGQRAVMVWFRWLRKMIPLSYSLAISFLCCHVARESILPTDIVKWSLEGKLPYFAAHIEIEKRFERPSPACPISSSVMFRPTQAVPVQKLESMAAIIAESIGLHLPPVNFYGIASRYLNHLSLPGERILQHACRIYEWSMPPDLWLSTSELRLPTRVGVMSILIVAIRILYNINGFGVWEKSLSRCYISHFSSQHTGGFDTIFSSKMRDDDEKGSISPSHMVDDLGDNNIRNGSHVQRFELDSAKLLRHLEERYNEIHDACEHAKDLPSYLQYCKDVVFAGAGQSHMDHEEEELMQKLWNFYQYEKNSEPAEELGVRSSIVFNHKRWRNDDGVKNLSENKKSREACHESLSADVSVYHADNRPRRSLDGDSFSHNSLEDQNLDLNNEASTEIEKGIRQMKLDMEENGFYYIPPRVNLKRFDYLHYARKMDDGALTYVAHTDYYILLRSCAKAAQVDIRIMHIGVLSFEKRLAWLEKRIGQCLHLTPPSVTCKFCTEDDLI